MKFEPSLQILSSHNATHSFVLLRLKRSVASISNGSSRHSKHIMLLRIAKQTGILIDPNGNQQVKLSLFLLTLIAKQLRLRKVVILTGANLNVDVPSAKKNVASMADRGWCLYVCITFILLSLQSPSLSMEELYEKVCEDVAKENGMERWLAGVGQVIEFFFDDYEQTHGAHEQGIV